MSIVGEKIPGEPDQDGGLRIRNVRIGGAANVVDLTIKDGRIKAIRESSRTAEWLCLPPLVDLHVHANRAFTPPDIRPKGLDDAARRVASIFSTFTADDYYRHACMLIDAAGQKGTSRLRTHADIGADVGLDAVVGSLRAAEKFADAVDVEVVAFASSSSDPASDNGREILRDAIASGAHYLGAAPAFCPDPMATIDAILDLAEKLDVPVDLHLDEHLNPERSFSEYLASTTTDRGLHGKVTLGHACAIAAMKPADRGRIIDRLVEAEITVIALPRTNLYLQDCSNGTPSLRGITPIQEMLIAGVAVRLASDNVRDVFYPYGDADLIGVAMDGILATQVDDPQAIIAMICDGRSSIETGQAADMLLLPGGNFDAVVSRAPAQRWVFRGGNLTRACQISCSV